MKSGNRVWCIITPKKIKCGRLYRVFFDMRMILYAYLRRVEWGSYSKCIDTWALSTHFWEAFSMHIYMDFSRFRVVVYAFLRWIRTPDMHFYVALAYQRGILYAFLWVVGIAEGHLLCISTGNLKYRLFSCMYIYSDIADLVCPLCGDFEKWISSCA